MLILRAIFSCNALFRRYRQAPSSSGLAMNYLSFLLKRCTFSILLATLLPAVAWASGGGSEKAAALAPAPMQFTVNVSDAEESDRYLQVTMVFDLATPESTQRLAEIKPKVQHRIILLLSEEKVASLRTTQGKSELQERLRQELNGLLDETPRRGVRDVFFTDFIIQ